mmetsp:Transcript_44068/g.107689  ORF Transcript_44068/g.107689 Transcript_44068/m.107689 type:complete len:525 (+) Transcript_44068:844-2418(+)
MEQLHHPLQEELILLDLDRCGRERLLVWREEVPRDVDLVDECGSGGAHGLLVAHDLLVQGHQQVLRQRLELCEEGADPEGLDGDGGLDVGGHLHDAFLEAIHEHVELLRVALAEHLVDRVQRRAPNVFALIVKAPAQVLGVLVVEELGTVGHHREPQRLHTHGPDLGVDVALPVHEEAVKEAVHLALEVAFGLPERIEVLRQALHLLLGGLARGRADGLLLPLLTRDLEEDVAAHEGEPDEHLQPGERRDLPQARRLARGKRAHPLHEVLVAEGGEALARGELDELAEEALVVLARLGVHLALLADEVVLGALRRPLLGDLGDLVVHVNVLRLHKERGVEALLQPARREEHADEGVDRRLLLARVRVVGPPARGDPRVRVGLPGGDVEQRVVLVRRGLLVLGLGPGRGLGRELALLGERGLVLLAAALLRGGLGGTHEAVALTLGAVMLALVIVGLSGLGLGARRRGALLLLVRGGRLLGARGPRHLEVPVAAAAVAVRAHRVGVLLVARLGAQALRLLACRRP